MSEGRDWWEETVLAGLLFAMLTENEDLFKSDMTGFASIEINHGVLKIEMVDGREFQLTVKKL